MTTKAICRIWSVTHSIPSKTNNRPGDVFSNEDIWRVIEKSSGEALYDGAAADIREEMIRRQRQGLGVEAATTTASAWRFGNTKQARSQQIPTV